MTGRGSVGLTLAALALALVLSPTGCGDEGGGRRAEGDSLDFGRLPTASPRLAPERTYEARDGARLPVRTYGAEGPIDLVLVHGSGAFNAYLADLSAAIADSGAAVVHTPDLRGHGAAPESAIAAERSAR